MSVINLNEARILITNDDGISAEGIKILRAIANEFSNDVWVVAPEHEKSGASHALSFQNELTLKKYEEKTFSVNGTPSDCVAIGISNVLKEKRPDLICQVSIVAVMLERMLHIQAQLLQQWKV